MVSRKWGSGGRFLSITKHHTIFLCAFGLVRALSVLLLNALSSNQIFCGDGGAAELADNHTGTAETHEKRCMPIIGFESTCLSIINSMLGGHTHLFRGQSRALDHHTDTNLGSVLEVINLTRHQERKGWSKALFKQSRNFAC